MSSALRKIKRSIQKNREFELTSPHGDVPVLIGKLRRVDGGSLFHQVGIVESPYKQAFADAMTSARQDPSGSNAIAKALESDGKEAREITNLSNRLVDAYIVLGFYDVRVKESGDPITIVYSDLEDSSEDSDTISVSELREVYGDLAVDMLDDKLHRMSNNGKPRPKAGGVTGLEGVARERFPAKPEVN